MKRITVIAVGILLSTAFAADAQAQSLLRGLKEKTVDKVKEKVENKVADTIGKVTGKSKAASTATPAEAAPTTTSSSSSQAGTSSNSDGSINYEYGLELCPSSWSAGIYFSLDDANQTEDSEGNLVPRIKQSSYNFATQSEALKALPAVPTARQIALDGEKQAALDALIDYNLAYTAYHERRMQELTERALKIAEAQMNSAAAGAKPRQKAPTMPTTNAFLDKLAQAMMKSGLNLETASEAEMMKVAVSVMSKEFGVPEADMGKVLAMAQTDPEGAMAFIAKKYPNAAKKMGVMQSETAAYKIEEDPDLDKCLDIFEEAASIISDPALMEIQVSVTKFYAQLESLAEELLSQWPSSEEHAKICVMEHEVDAQLETYMQAHNISYNDEAPDFWQENRKAQNAVIDAFNVRIAEQWRAKIQEYADMVKPHAIRVADVEDRLNAAVKNVSKKPSNDFILRFQDVVAGIDNIPFDFLFSLPAQAMDAPFVSHVPEKWMP